MYQIFTRELLMLKVGAIKETSTNCSVNYSKVQSIDKRDHQCSYYFEIRRYLIHFAITLKKVMNCPRNNNSSIDSILNHPKLFPVHNFQTSTHSLWYEFIVNFMPAVWLHTYKFSEHKKWFWWHHSTLCYYRPCCRLHDLHNDASAKLRLIASHIFHFIRKQKTHSLLHASRIQPFGSSPSRSLLSRCM